MRVADVVARSLVAWCVVERRTRGTYRSIKRNPLVARLGHSPQVAVPFASLKGA